MEAKGINFKSFEGNNFLAWKDETKYRLMALDLWGVVSGDEREPEAAAARREWRAKQMKAFGLLSMAIAPDCRVCLRGIEDGNATLVWQQLQERYGVTSPESEMITLRKLIRLKCDSKVGAELEYIRSFHDLNNVLVTCGTLLPDKLLRVLLLEGLPEEYENFRKILFMSQLDMDVAHVQSLIESEAQARMLRTPERDQEDEQILMARGHRRMRQKNGRKILCYRCDQPGQYAKDCPQRTNHAHLVTEGSAVDYEF